MKASAGVRQEAESAAVNEIEKTPALAAFGAVFKSSRPIELTETETEYVVTCTKHIFAEHIVFQFTCRNTLNDSQLENVSVLMRIEATEDDDALAMQQVASIPAEKLVYDVPASVFVAFRKPPHSSPTGKDSS